MKYKIWNKEETLVTPIGEVLTKEQVFERYPMAQLPMMDFIICDSHIQLGVFMEYTQSKETYKPMILNMAKEPTMTEVELLELEQDYASLTQSEFLELMSFYEENPTQQEATAEERIASALEFQNLLSMPEQV